MPIAARFAFILIRLYRSSILRDKCLAIAYVGQPTAECDRVAPRHAFAILASPRKIQPQQVCDKTNPGFYI